MKRVPGAEAVTTRLSSPAAPLSVTGMLEVLRLNVAAPPRPLRTIPLTPAAGSAEVPEPEGGAGRGRDAGVVGVERVGAAAAVDDNPAGAGGGDRESAEAGGGGGDVPAADIERERVIAFGAAEVQRAAQVQDVPEAGAVNRLD